MSRLVPAEKIAKEKTLAQAIDLARQALVDITKEEMIGEHRGVVLEGDRVLTHAFDCLMPGYVGWYWTVTLSRVPRSRKPTIDELSLRPGEGALLAPAWVPWEERLSPDDVSDTDLLPYRADDPRLVEGTETSTEEDGSQLAEFEKGLGRRRVLSELGRSEAFERWYSSDRGPRTRATKAAKAKCSTCGFLMLLAGSARTIFGVCANEWSSNDGRVVSLDHGCGAHSETDAPKGRQLWEQSEPVLDEADLDIVKV